MRIFLVAFAVAFALRLTAGAACLVNGTWDPDYTWIKDCTPNNPYDGQYAKAGESGVVSGEMKLQVGSENHTLSWRLHWYKASSAGGPASKDSLPLVLGLHSWTDGATIDTLLNSESSLMEYEGAWEDAIFLTVALETGNNLGTWWDGKKVDGKPLSWTMDAIVELVKARINDAPALLAGAGATGLANRKIDVNRVYLIGTSMGGSGTYHIGLKHPEIFAAIHATAGFADYNGNPCGNENFCKVFDSDFIGTTAENLQMPGLDGQAYPARKYSNMSWFVGEHNGASWSASLGKGKRYEPPYINMTHGSTDVSVDISSADRLFEVLKKNHFGFSYQRHAGGHSQENFAHMDWLFGFRRNQSYLAFTNNSTDVIAGTQQYNGLNKIGWVPGSIVDKLNHYEIQIVGTGTTDITPRRLQNFRIESNAGYRWWLNSISGTGTETVADSTGALTLPAVSLAGTTLLIIQPAVDYPEEIYFTTRRSNSPYSRPWFAGTLWFPALSGSSQTPIDILGRSAPVPERMTP